mgnify:CR=1 FL=1
MSRALEQRIWFNPQIRSTDFLVPGVLAVIMTLIGALLTALVITREWERGTMEALLVTRISVNELLLGKLIPYFILGMGGLTLSLVMARFLFHVPMRGSLWLFIATSALFLLVALGMGLFISTMVRSQFVASLIAIISTFLPAFILSGGTVHILSARSNSLNLAPRTSPDRDAQSDVNSTARADTAEDARSFFIVAGMAL